MEQGDSGSKQERARTKQPATRGSGASVEVLRTPPRINLSSVEDVRREMARVYRDMRAAKLDTQDGTRLVYVLDRMLKAFELTRTETATHCAGGNPMSSIKRRLERLEQMAREHQESEQRPLTLMEFYAEIERDPLYLFNSERRRQEAARGQLH